MASTQLRAQFRHAVKAGNVETLGAILKSHPAILHEALSEERNWLHVAAMSAQPDSVVFLVSQGLAVNTRDSDGYTPLYHAFNNGCLETMQALLEGGAAANSQFDHYSLLHLSLHLDDPVSFIKLLIQHGATPQTMNKDRHTPLSLAAVRGQHDAVMALLAHGADPCWKPPGVAVRDAVEEAMAVGNHQIAADIRAWMQVQEAHRAVQTTGVLTSAQHLKPLT